MDVVLGVEVKVSKKHLNALAHGKGFNLSRSEHNTAPHLIHIHYRDAKHARFHEKFYPKENLHYE